MNIGIRSLFIAFLVLQSDFIFCNSEPLVEAQKEGVCFAEKRLEDVQDVLKKAEKEAELDNYEDKTRQLSEGAYQNKNSEAVSWLESRVQSSQNLSEKTKLSQELDGRGMAASDVQKAIGALSNTEEVSSADSKRETCQESDPYEFVVRRTLKVHVKPAITEQVRVCRGHKTRKEIYFKSAVDKWTARKNTELANDPSIGSFDVKVLSGSKDLDKNYMVEAFWKHVEVPDSSSPHFACSNFQLEERVITPAAFQDSWEIDPPNAVSLLDSSSDTKVIQRIVVEGPGIREIEGEKVSRDMWSEDIIYRFSGGKSDGKCTFLRKMGGAFVSKKCLKEDALGKCSFWEKEYEMRGKACSTKQVYEFSGEEIFGLGKDQNVPSYEQNKDFGSVFGVLASLTGLADAEISKGQVGLFGGSIKKCTRSFVGGAVYDCCRGMDGVALSLKFARCNEEEKCLADFREKGACHYIGTQRKKLGTEVEQVYACFPSKLTRLIQEQGRKQLGLGWGTVEKPLCRGFSTEEMKRLNFEAMDLQEAIEGAMEELSRQDFLRVIKESAKRFQGEIDSGQALEKSEALLKNQAQVVPRGKGL